MEAQKVAAAYLRAWNEAHEQRRADLLASDWTPDARYADPLMRGEGTAQISSLIAAVHQRFPGFAFRLKGTPDGHGEYVRLSWELGPEGSAAPIEGSDVIQLRDEKIFRVIGFIDRAPNAI